MHISLIIFSYHHTTVFHHILLVVFFISFLLSHLLLILLHLFSTLSGDPPQFIIWKTVTSFPLSIPQTLIQRPLVWEGYLIGESLWYFWCLRARPSIIDLIFLGLICFCSRCVHLYICKKNEQKKNEMKRKISICVYVHSIFHRWVCILISEGHFIEYVCWWEFVCELFEIFFSLYSLCHIFC